MNNDFVAIIVGDPHTMGHTPVNRLDNFPETMLNKWNEIIELAPKVNADHIFVLGDILDSAEAAYTTIGNLGLVLKKSSVPISSIIGNHDIIGGNLNTYKRTGLGLIEKFEFINIIEDDKPIYIEKDNLKVQITGKSYHSNIDHQSPELDYCVKKMNNATHAIHLAHGYLTPKKLLFAHTLVDHIVHETEADATFSGHLHTPFLVQQHNKYFGNPGALGRITASKAELRMPHVFICRINQEGVLSIEIYYIKCALPPEEVIDRTSLEEEDVHYYRMNEFIQSVEGFNGQRIINPFELVHAIASSNDIHDDIKQDALQEISLAEIELSEA